MKISLLFLAFFGFLMKANAQSTTIVSITPPANGTYNVGSNLDFIVNYSSPVNVTGTPRIAMNVNEIVRYANYISGSGTSSLTFRYTVAAGNGTPTGISIANPLQLNGGTITDQASTPASLVFKNTFYGAILINAPLPSIVSVSGPGSMPPLYTSGQTIDFTVVWSEPMVANKNTSRLKLDVGGIFQSATMVSGSGTSTFTYRYTVGVDHFDADGVVMISPLDFNGSSITNSGGLTPTKTYTPPSLVSMKVDGKVPTVVSNTKPVDGTYTAGDYFDFSVMYSRIVNVTGNPRVQINMGYVPTEVAKYADYVSGSGTNTLNFRYTIQPGDDDSDGVYFNQWLNMDLGSIVDNVGNDASYAFWGLKLVSYGASLAVVDGAPTPTISLVTPPTNGKFTTGQSLDFLIQFNRPVVVTLIPRLALTIGSTTVYANYQSGGGTNTLLFRYTVQDGDVDTDGISITSPIDLNGGAIQNLTLAYNADLNFTAPDLSGVLVDGINPTIASITPPASKTYVQSESMNFSVNFTQPVYVTGSPRLGIVVGASTVYADYVSGSGTTTLNFTHVVAASELDSDGVTTISPLDLSGGTLKDLFGDDVNLSFTAATYAGVKVDTIPPSISSVTGPAAGTYSLGQVLTFTVNTDEPVNVIGTPKISFIVGTTGKDALYSPGSSTSTSLAFTYTVASGDLDADGILMLSPLLLNGGTIRDLGGNDLASLTFTVPDTSGVIVDGTTGILSVTPPANGSYITGSNLNFTVNYSRKVRVTGIPRIALTVGSQTYYANYVSGDNSTVLTFRYTVLAGHSDVDGIVLTSPIDLNGGTITGVSGSAVNFVAPDTSGVLVDGIDVAITSVTPPADGTYGVGQEVFFIVNYNYSANVVGPPRIQLTVGSTTRYADYYSGSGTAAHLFRYVVQTGDNDTDGITSTGTSIDLNGGSIKDNFSQDANVSFTSGNYPNVKVDGIVPTITNVTGPANGTYGSGANLDFTVTASEVMTVTGTPRIAITIGSTTRYANYFSGSGTSTLVFRYTVVAGELDNNGIVAASLVSLNGGTMKDAGQNSFSSLSFTPLNLTGVMVNSLISITSVTPPANGTYVAGNTLDFTVNFSDIVNVTGTPRINITAGASTVYANYLSGGGTNTLTFRYTVVSGDNDLDGITMVSPITLNGGSVNDVGGSPVSLAYTLPNTSGIIINAGSTTVASITPPADGHYPASSALNFVVTYSSAAFVTGTPRIQLNVGGATLYADYVSGSGTSVHTFRYTVAAAQNDADGIATVGPAIQLNGGSITDVLGNNVSLNFTAATYGSVFVDTTAPSMSSMGAPASKTYAENESIDFTATYSEAVTISGTPRLVLTIGATTAYANYFSGSGTNTIVFRYVVPINLLDSNGIAATNTLDTNGGTIRDLATNTQTNFAYTVPNLLNVLVDSMAPSISTISTPASQTYTTGAAINFTVTYNEAVAVTGSPNLTLTVGSVTRNASYVSGSGTPALVFRYTVLAGDNDSNGIDRVSPLILNGGTIKDLQGNSAGLTFTNLTMPGVIVDALAPTLTSVTLPVGGAYKTGGTRSTISFTVNYDEPVTVVGTPRIHTTIGSTLRYATYASGSGTSSLIFSYAVAAADFDMDGIVVGNLQTIDLNGGTIRDTVGFNAPTSLGSLNTSDVLVVHSPMASWYDVSDSAHLTFNGSNVSGLLDKVGSYNLTHTSAGGATYNPTNFNGGAYAYVTCTNASSFDGANQISPMAVVAVFRAPTTVTGQYLFYLGSTGRPMLQFSSTANGGTIAFGSTTGRKYSAGAWSAAGATVTNAWVSGGVTAKAFAFSANQKRPNQLCEMDGQLAEAFFYSAQPTVAQMQELEAYINNRYGLSF